MMDLIRPFHDDDDIERITDVIHKGYAVLAVNGLRFWGTHQSAKDTLDRLNKGAGFVAVLDGVIVGTVTIRPPDPESEVEFYRHPTTWILNQFAVLPEHAGKGIGRALHDHAVTHAMQKGCNTCCTRHCQCSRTSHCNVQAMGLCSCWYV
ncbi:MAG: GNAT family N-acetyltransferase [Ignavibacteria bacterium]|nr:GNAT family N-acetyltransferase [Ignavibacteria bacterium]